MKTTKTGSDRENSCARRVLTCLSACLLLAGCADVTVPGGRNVDIPNPSAAEQRREAINEKPDSVMYLPLGKDVLVPEVAVDDPLPDEIVGPFELRSETLAGALQLVMGDYEVPLAFETEAGLNRRITVANLKGPLSKVVRRICSLADLYCSYEDGVLVVKDKQTFTVKIPPISQDTSFMQNVAGGLQAIVGAAPVIDQSTRTIVYQATQRTSELAARYFQRMRSSTALIVFETYIWEVSLNAGNSSGIQWNQLGTLGKFLTSVDIQGSIGADFTDPISIGLPTTGGVNGGAFTPTDVLDFLSTFGAVKTISQPQITVLSGSEATLRAADTENYVAEVSETIDDGLSRTAVNTSSIDTGFTLSIKSAWDNATVYADVEIMLTDVSEIEDFDFQSGDGGSTTVQLPKSTERELTTQVRVRPGDSILIAGLVRESDAYDSSGIGFMKPILPNGRTATTRNLELVFLLRPRVVVYTSPSEHDYYSSVKGTAANSSESKSDFQYDFAPLTQGGETDPAEMSADVADEQVTTAPVPEAMTISGDGFQVGDMPAAMAPVPQAAQVEYQSTGNPVSLKALLSDILTSSPAPSSPNP